MSKFKKQKKILIKKKANKPFFSVITVVKNAEIDIVKTLKSIKNQTFKNFEYIVIDGESKDQTLNHLLATKQNINLLVSKKDKGIYNAMNKGLTFANGKVIVFINAGDVFTKNALRIIFKKFEKKPFLDFVFGTVKRHYHGTTILKYGYNKNRLKYNFDFATSHSTGFFIKKKSMKLVGKYNTNFKYSADYDLYYRVLINLNMRGDFTKRNELIGIFNKGGFSSKVNFFDHLIEETKIRIHNHQNLIFVAIIFVNAVFKNLIKTLIK